MIVQANAGRMKLIGLFQSELLVAVIAAPVGTGALALISLRRVSKKEREIRGC